MSNNAVSEMACVVERVVGAPVSVVWQMWTESVHFKQWYGPQGFTIPVAEMDVCVGGKRLVCMSSPDGSMTMWTTGEYTEIVPNERLVYTESPSDEAGNPVSPQAMGMPEGYPAVTEVTVVFEDLGEQTKMILTHAGVPAGAAGGWSQAFDKMTVYVVSLS